METGDWGWWGEQKRGHQASGFRIGGLGESLRERESDQGSWLLKKSLPLMEMHGVWEGGHWVSSSAVLLVLLVEMVRRGPHLRGSHRSGLEGLAKLGQSEFACGPSWVPQGPGGSQVLPQHATCWQSWRRNCPGWKVQHSANRSYPSMLKDPGFLKFLFSSMMIKPLNYLVKIKHF